MVLVIVKAFTILEYVARDPNKAYSLPEIAEAMQLHQATCANILKTLVEINYLEHLGRKRGYRLGPMAYNLTNNHSYSENLINAAKDVMEQLTKSLNETSILGIIRNNKRFIVHLVNSDQDLSVRSRTERNIYESATGRLLLAFLPEKERSTLLVAIGQPPADIWPEASTPEGFEKCLVEIRQKELALTRSKSHIIGLAVPIRKGDQVIASLSVFLPEVRCSPERQQVIEHSLQQAGKTISQRLLNT